MSGNELTNETMEGVTVEFSEMPKNTNVLTKVAVVGLIAAVGFGAYYGIKKWKKAKASKTEVVEENTEISEE